jgi:hypothetical protein
MEYLEIGYRRMPGYKRNRHYGQEIEMRLLNRKGFEKEAKGVR